MWGQFMGGKSARNHQVNIKKNRIYSQPSAYEFVNKSKYLSIDD